MCQGHDPSLVLLVAGGTGACQRLGSLVGGSFWARVLCLQGTVALQLLPFTVLGGLAALHFHHGIVSAPRTRSSVSSLPWVSLWELNPKWNSSPSISLVSRCVIVTGTAKPLDLGECLQRTEVKWINYLYFISNTTISHWETTQKLVFKWLKNKS